MGNFKFLGVVLFNFPDFFFIVIKLIHPGQARVFLLYQFKNQYKKKDSCSRKRFQISLSLRDFKFLCVHHLKQSSSVVEFLSVTTETMESIGPANEKDNPSLVLREDLPSVLLHRPMKNTHTRFIYTKGLSTHYVGKRFVNSIHWVGYDIVLFSFLPSFR